MVDAISARSARPVRTIKRPIALPGGVLLTIVTVFLVRSELDPIKVVTLVAWPVGFAVGAMLTRDGSSARLRRLSGRWVVALLIVATLTVTAAAAATLEVHPTGEYTIDDGVANIGAPATDVLGDGWLDQQSSMGLGYLSAVTLSPEPPNLLDGWRELRLEAWPVVDRAVVISVGSRPFAIAPMTRDEFGTYSAQVDLDTSKERRWYAIATTGIAPDGNRYVLSGPDGPVAARPWTGTVWEWITTP